MILTFRSHWDILCQADLFWTFVDLQWRTFLSISQPHWLENAGKQIDALMHWFIVRVQTTVSFEFSDEILLFLSFSRSIFHWIFLCHKLGSSAKEAFMHFEIMELLTSDVLIMQYNNALGSNTRFELPELRTGSFSTLYIIIEEWKKKLLKDWVLLSELRSWEQSEEKNWEGRIWQLLKRMIMCLQGDFSAAASPKTM